MFKHQGFFINITMPKIKADSKTACQDHIFKFKAEKQDCYYQETIKVKFCIQNTKAGTRALHKVFQGPVFNKDKASSTPAFILKSEQDKFKSTAAFLGNRNPQKYFNIAQSKSQLLMPKPSSKSFYCNVCKQKYQDYMQHIQSEKHRNKINFNPFNKHIQKLVNKYQKNRNYKEKQKELNLQTLSELSNLIVIDVDSFDEKQMSKPRKMKKLQKKNVQNYVQAPRLPQIPFYNCFQPPPIVINQERQYQSFNNLNPFFPVQPEATFYSPILPILNIIDAQRFYSMNMLYNPYRCFTPGPTFYQVNKQQPGKLVNKPECIIIDDN